MPKKRYRRFLLWTLALFLLAALSYFSLPPVLSAAGAFLVRAEEPVPSGAAVVLATGAEYYPRLMEAASLFQKGYVKRIVINGNRKTEALRELERRGFVPCCPWYENSLRILSVLGVPRESVMYISAEDAYDTISEANAVGRELLRAGITRIILITSKYHTRRAGFIWERSFRSRFFIRTVGASADPYSPDGWWKEGRQIRWVLAEYGAWLYYYWKSFLKVD